VTDQTERLRAALDTVFAGRVYRWAGEPAPSRLVREWSDRLSEWLRGLRADNPVVFRLLILALLLALVLILAHAAWLVWRTVRAARAAEAAQAEFPTTEPRDADWYGRAADRAAAEGRFAEALQLAFVALALGLDRQGLLQYHASKTPAECARDARLAPTDRERLRGLVRTLYLHAFGGRPAALDDYRHWRAAGAEPWHAPAG
jgi:ABC-type nickel/cobalt efflux system permease component RcnA